MDTSKPSEDEDSEGLGVLRERIRGAMNVYLTHSPETGAAKVREYLDKTLREANSKGSMDDSIKVWRPHGAQEAWSVPWNGPPVMNKEQYRGLLESRLRDLIAADPKQAKDELTGAAESSPDLYQIGLNNDPKDYAPLMVRCDQMQMFLNRIDWKKPGQSQSLDRNDLPSLSDICATIP